MDVILYVSGKGELAITPDCYLPSIELERRYGPMTFCGRATIDDDVFARGWGRIANDMRRQTYALLDVEEAKEILGARHACFRQVRKLVKRAANEG